MIRLILMFVLLASRGADAASEQLVVFVQPGVSLVSDAFEADHLGAWRDMADELGIELRVVNVRESGAPAEIGLTPMLVYQSARGRSIYQGRYATVDRVRNFVRTSRVVPQGDAPLVRAEVPVLEDGRMKIALPIKLTELRGAVPDGHDPDRFRAEANAAIADGLPAYEWRDEVSLSRTDRQFYIDFHPYVSEQGELFVSVEAYSQFHCHDPVFSRLQDPVRGPWQERDRVFAEAASLLASEIDFLLAFSDLGDGFDPVRDGVALVSRDDLGLALPEAEEGAAATGVDLTLPAAWTARPASAGDPAAVVFTFPAPLDSYTGEARRLAGSIELASAGRVNGATGRFEVEAASVTMGEADLDKHIHGDAVLDVRDYPVSSFTIESVESGDPEIAFGRLTNAVMQGTFELKGIRRPLAVRASFEPIVLDDGTAGLVLTATWSLRLTDPFGIEGPDGPAPQNDQLEFVARIVFHGEAPTSGN